MRFNSPSILSLLAAVASLGYVAPASAARYLTATVEQDGKVILETSYTDASIPYRERVWRYLSQEPGFKEAGKITASPKDALRANLRGELVIRIRHVEKILVEGKASALSLTRTSASSDRWLIPASEVERIASENKIPKPSLLALSRDEASFAVFIGVAALLVGVLGFYVVRRMRASPRFPSPRE